MKIFLGLCLKCVSEDFWMIIRELLNKIQHNTTAKFSVLDYKHLFIKVLAKNKCNTPRTLIIINRC